MTTILKGSINLSNSAIYNPNSFLISSNLSKSQADQLYASKNNPIITGTMLISNEEIQGTAIFDALPAVSDSSIMPSIGAQLATKQYIDNSIGGISFPTTFTNLTATNLTASNFNLEDTSGNLVIRSDNGSNTWTGNGSGNVVIGQNAGKNNVSSNNNIIIGNSGDNNGQNLNNCVMIGYNTSVTNPTTTYTNAVCIGNNSQISGDNIITLGTNTSNVYTVGNVSFYGSYNTFQNTVTLGSNYNTYTTINGSINLGSGTGAIVYNGTSHNFLQVPSLDSSLNNTNITNNNHLVNKQYADNLLNNLSYSVSYNMASMSLNTYQTVDASNNAVLIVPNLGTVSSGLTTSSVANNVYINLPTLPTNASYVMFQIPLKVQYWFSQSGNITSSSIANSNSSYNFNVQTSSSGYTAWSADIILTFQKSGSKIYMGNVNGSTAIINGGNSQMKSIILTNTVNQTTYGSNFVPFNTSWDATNKRIVVSMGMPNLSNDPTKNAWISSIGWSLELTANCNGYGNTPTPFLNTNLSNKVYFSLT